MLLADASRYLDPSQRQVFDTLARIAIQAREAEQRNSVESQSFQHWLKHTVVPAKTVRRTR